MFLTKLEIHKEARVEIDIDLLQSKCGTCKLHKNCKSPKMEYSGDGAKKILVIGDTPSDADDQNSIQFSGASGSYLKELLLKGGISLNRDCWKVNAVRCNNSLEELNNTAKLCSGYILKLLYTLKPTHVLILGSAGIVSLFGDDFNNREVQRWRGVSFPDDKFKTRTFITYHPSEIKKNSKDRLLAAVFERDIVKFCSTIKSTSYIEHSEYEKHVKHLLLFTDVKRELERILRDKPEYLYHDYETSGLKPYSSGHFVASISFAYSENQAFVFPLDYNQYWKPEDLRQIKELWCRILADKDIGKIAHNCFSGDTKYITKDGLLSFKDSVNSVQQVWTKKGWKRADIKGFEKQSLTKIEVRPFNRSRSTVRNEFLTTPNHRWIIDRRISSGKWKRIDGITTSELRLKDRIVSEIPKFEINQNSDSFRHGLIFADGSKSGVNRKTPYYQIRLCGDKEKYKYLFKKYTYPGSSNGDPVVNYYHSKDDLKEVPDSSKDAEYVANFIEGWQLLDGTDSTAGNSRVVTTTSLKNAEWLRDNCSLAGWYCTGISEHEKPEGPYGPCTLYYMIILSKDQSMGWTITEIEDNNSFENVYCAVVDEIDEFTLQHGIYTKNCKFEDSWSTVTLKQETSGWIWDTQMAAHILDNRKQWSGLKFQVFIELGVRPYDKFIDPFIHSDTEFNTVHKAPLKELLMYCGLDSLFGFKLFNKQKTAFSGRKGLLFANDFFMKGTLCMSRIQQNGIITDEEYYRKQKLKLTYYIKKIRRKLTGGREAQKFFERFQRHINLASGPDLGKLFYEVLGRTPIYTGNVNAKGEQNYKTDAKTLSKLNLPYVDKLIEMRKLIKARDTYFAQFAREVHDGVMHPFFDLGIPVSYRSSSSKPNWQNLPKRNEKIKKAVRSGIKPRKRRVLSEIDFSGAEVITSSSYHKDPTFIAYLKDKSTDMHRDQALDIWQLDRSELENSNFTREEKAKASKIRFYAKNNWTFAQFYGDWYDSCARMLWENCIENENLVLPSGKLLYDHCKSVGVYTVEDLIEHCKKVEDKLWNERFPVYTRWKKNIVKFYEKHGFIETYLGFRFVGYMDRKQCANYPIQGTSFHLLVYTLLEVEKFIKKNKLKTLIIGQIHDSIVMDIPTEEVDFVLRSVVAIIGNLHTKFKWLALPMEAECSISKSAEDGGNFSDMYDVKPKFLNGEEEFNFSKIYEK